MLRQSHVILLLVAGTMLPIGSPPRAKTPDAFTLVHAVRSALEQHPSVASMRAGRDEARAAVGEAAAAWYPTLTLSGSATRYQEPTLAAPIHGFQPSEIPPFDETLFVTNLNLGYSIFDGGGRAARVRQARSRLEAVDATLNGAEQSLASRVVAAYLTVLSRKQILEAHGHRLEALRSEQDRVGLMRAAGRAAAIEQLRVEAALSAAEAERVALVSALDVAERDLARLVGSTPDQTRADRLAAVTLRDTSLVAREILLSDALQKSPAVRQGQEQLSAARAGLRAAGSARWPHVRLVGNYTDWADAAGDETAEWNAGVHLSLPLFTGGAIGKGIERAEAAARGSEEQLRLVELQVSQDLDRALSALEETRARVASLERAVARFEEVVRIERLSLEAGSGTQTDYLNAEADLLSARASLIDARHRLVTARVELSRVTGSLSIAWLAENVEAGQ